MKKILLIFISICILVILLFYRQLLLEYAYFSIPNCEIIPEKYGIKIVEKYNDKKSISILLQAYQEKLISGANYMELDCILKGIVAINSKNSVPVLMDFILNNRFTENERYIQLQATRALLNIAKIKTTMKIQEMNMTDYEIEDFFSLYKTFAISNFYKNHEDKIKGIKLQEELIKEISAWWNINKIYYNELDIYKLKLGNSEK